MPNPFFIFVPGNLILITLRSQVLTLRLALLIVGDGFSTAPLYLGSRDRVASFRESLLLMEFFYDQDSACLE